VKGPTLWLSSLTPELVFPSRDLLVPLGLPLLSWYLWKQTWAVSWLSWYWACRVAWLSSRRLLCRFL